MGVSEGVRERQARALAGELKARAMSLGFSAFGIARLDRIEDRIKASAAGLEEFVAKDRHGEMTWLAETAARRSDPRHLMADARSIIMLGMNYAPPGDPMAGLSAKDRSVISVYAKGRDYHDVIKGRLKELAGLIAARSGSDVKVFVDTAPLMEKPLAQSAGLGWQGKHTNLVSRDHGSWLFLGAILTAAALPEDVPEADHCGSCARCLEACPTHAFPAPYQLDARRCISYLTIEHAGHIAPEFRQPIGNRVFGCDDCLAVCPWNKFAEGAHEAKFAAGIATDNPPLAELIVLDETAFRSRFAGTPVKRTGRDKFLRNVLIAAGNSKDGSLVPLIVPLLRDGSPLVRAMAVWALSRLAGPGEMADLRAMHYDQEADAAVRAEWDAAAGRQP